MHSILEKAYQTLAADQGGMGYGKEAAGEPLGFVHDMAAASVSFQDLQLFGGGDLQLDNLHQLHLGSIHHPPPPDHGLYLTASPTLTGKKIMASSHHDPYVTNPSEKSPFIWDDDEADDDDGLRVGKQQGSSRQNDQLIQNIGIIAPAVIDGYEAKPTISNADDFSSGDRLVLEGSAKLKDRPSPLRDHPLSVEAINAMLINRR